MTPGATRAPDRNRVVDVLTLFGTGSGAVLVCREAGAAPSFWLVVYVLAVIVVVRMVSLGIHELGHLIAASTAGWRWDLYKVGPLLLSRENGGLRASLRGGRHFKAVGFVLTRPVSPAQNTTSRHILMLSGGPIASALLSALAWVAFCTVDAPLPRIALGITGVFSAIVFVTTLLPFVSAGNASDGATIRSLLRQRAVSNTEGAAIHD